jgi:hypothetical protein
VGEEDHIKPAVQELGSLDLWQIAIKPGKPFAHGRIGKAHFVGLPGNPVSSFVTFLLLVRPMLIKLQGAADAGLRGVPTRSDFDWSRPDKRQEFLRVRRNAAGGLDVFANQSSGVLTSLVWGDGLVNVPPLRHICRHNAVPNSRNSSPGSGDTVALPCAPLYAAGGPRRLSRGDRGYPHVGHRQPALPEAAAVGSGGTKNCKF